MPTDVHAAKLIAEEETILKKRLEVNEDIQIGEAEQTPGLETYGYGAVAETTLLSLQEGTIYGDPVPPFCWGAGCYKAVNNDVQGDTIGAGFVTETSRSEGTPPALTFHKNEDIMGVFGSYAYSGNEDPELLGGLATQAAENHAGGSLGTKLLLMYTRCGNSSMQIGAVLDESGCFITDEFRHIGGKIGFFGAEKTSRLKVNLFSLETKVDTLVKALETLGLIETETVQV